MAKRWPETNALDCELEHAYSSVSKVPRIAALPYCCIITPLSGSAENTTPHYYDGIFPFRQLYIDASTLEWIMNSDKYSAYCREHVKEFRDELRDDASRALASWPGKSAGFLLVISSVLTYLNLSASGNPYAYNTLFTYAVPILLFFHWDSCSNHTTLWLRNRNYS